MILEQIAVGELRNFAYLVGDEKSKLGAIVDPAGDVGKILDTVDRKGLTLEYVINTHAHHDHVSGNRFIVSKTGAKIAMHYKATLERDISVQDGDIVQVGKVQIRIVHTPGHTPESICLLVDGALLTGDTLFVGECGRTDLPGGSSSDMYDSLFNKIAKLDRNLIIYPGHNYGKTPSSTLGHEIDTNYTLKPRSREEFIRFMSEP